jgi:hypothetical protein
LCACQAPTNDDFLSVLLEKRTNLGFTNALPEHTTGFRCRLAELFDEVDPNPEKQVCILAFDGLPEAVVL